MLKFASIFLHEVKARSISIQIFHDDKSYKELCSCCVCVREREREREREIIKRKIGETCHSDEMIRQFRAVKLS